MTDFRCLKCAMPKTRVADVRPSGAFRLRRRRKCECGHAFTTFEIPADDFELLAVDGGIIAKLDKTAHRLNEIIAGVKARTRQT